MARPKDIGTAGETAVVRYLREHGFPGAERRALSGALDKGDITGCPGICIEVKSGAQTRSPTPSTLTSWWLQTQVERHHAGAELGVLVLSRSGYSAGRAGHWWAYLALTLDGRLWTHPSNHPGVVARVELADAVTMLRTAGYGTPLEVEA